MRHWKSSVNSGKKNLRDFQIVLGHTTAEIIGCPSSLAQDTAPFWEYWPGSPWSTYWHLWLSIYKTAYIFIQILKLLCYCHLYLKSVCVFKKSLCHEKAFAHSLCPASGVRMAPGATRKGSLCPYKQLHTQQAWEGVRGVIPPMGWESAT